MPRTSETRKHWVGVICKELVALRDETKSGIKVDRAVHGGIVQKIVLKIMLPEIITINRWVRACGSTLPKFLSRPAMIELAELDERAQSAMDEELKRGFRGGGTQAGTR